jgi:hypothetical protein
MRTKLYLVLAILFLIGLIYIGCSRDSIVNTQVVTAQGVFVLYEGSFSAGSGDYSFIDLSNDNVTSNVFQNSNSGAVLPLFPDGLNLFVNKNLYIVCQGNYGGHGKMFKIDGTTNKLLDTSAGFGTNPYDLAYAYNNNNSFYITNISGSTVTQIDTALNVTTPSIEVGPNPSDLIFAQTNMYVAKTSYTTENSLAIINTLSNNVTKAYFAAPPVSVANNTGGIYVSTYTKKTLYVLDSIFITQIDDSVVIPSNYAAIGDVIAGDPRSLFVVGLDVVSMVDVGKEVWKYDIFNKTTTRIIPNQSGQSIYGISYEPYSKLIYIADSKGGVSNGEVRVYDTDGTLKKTYEIGGKYPRRFAFKNQQQ